MKKKKTQTNSKPQTDKHLPRKYPNIRKRWKWWGFFPNKKKSIQYKFLLLKSIIWRKYNKNNGCFRTCSCYFSLFNFSNCL